MNKRIRELADNIWSEEYWSNPNTDKLLPAQLNRFAELIVRECANMAESFHHHQYDFTGNLELHEFIKTHFGVEE